MRISDWSSDVCSSDLVHRRDAEQGVEPRRANPRRQRLHLGVGNQPPVPLDQAAGDRRRHNRSAQDDHRRRVAEKLSTAMSHAYQAQLDANTPESVWSANTVYRRSEEHTSELQSLMRISYAV